MRPIFLCLVLLSTPAVAADGLLGKDMTFQIVTYDDPAVMIYESRVYRATVGDGPELGLDAEGKRDIDLIPVIVDVSASRVTLDYSNADPGPFYKAKFNGYIIEFEPGCPEIAGAHLDPAGTTMGIGNKRLKAEDRRLSINVSDLVQDRDSRIAIDLDLFSCK